MARLVVPARRTRGLESRRDADPGAILAAFSEHRVDFVVIGGLAAIAHGAQRTTRDFDVLIDPGAKNCRRVIAVLADLAAKEFIPQSRRWIRIDAKAAPGWLLKQPRFFDTDAGAIDICNAMEGVPTWPDAEKGSIEVAALGQSFRVLDKDTFIRSKLAAGRDQDLRDVTEINELDASS